MPTVCLSPMMPQSDTETRLPTGIPDPGHRAPPEACSSVCTGAQKGLSPDWRHSTPSASFLSDLAVHNAYQAHANHMRDLSLYGGA